MPLAWAPLRPLPGPEHQQLSCICVCPRRSDGEAEALGGAGPPPASAVVPTQCPPLRDSWDSPNADEGCTCHTCTPAPRTGGCQLPEAAPRPGPILKRHLTHQGRKGTQGLCPQSARLCHFPSPSMRCDRCCAPPPPLAGHTVVSRHRGCCVTARALLPSRCPSHSTAFWKPHSVD